MREFAKAVQMGFYRGGRRREGSVFELTPGDECPAWARPCASPVPADPVPADEVRAQRGKRAPAAKADPVPTDPVPEQ